MPSSLVALFVGAILIVSLATSTRAADDTIRLAGTWQFALDPKDAGEREAWFSKNFPDQIKLPGSLQEQGFGDYPSADTKWISGIGSGLLKREKYAPYAKPGDQFETPFWLTPARHYVGAAWYARDVEIPSDWKDKRIVLSLQRPHWETSVWIDGKNAGMQNSLGVPHEYDLTAALAAPGKHHIAIRVDNRVKIPVGLDAHSVSDQTQSDWNGIVGALELRAGPKIWFDDVQIYPDAAAKKVKVIAQIGNATGSAGAGTIVAHAESFNTGKPQKPADKTIPVKWTGDAHTQVEFEYQLGADAQLWDEFSPALYRLSLDLKSDAASLASKEATFGLRDLGTKGTQFTMNSRPIFLRGTLECCIFPLTGYPPTDVDSWKRILHIAREHGLNHLRFHSWCPPEAAFVAADEMGFYYQVEGSCWAHFGDGSPLDKWIYDETARMLKAYGNHPSFVLMAASNEPAGKNRERFLGDWVKHFAAADARRMYTAGSGWPHVPENQYHIMQDQRIHQNKELDRPPQTLSDYTAILAKYKVPMITHEMGQWCVYPNVDEIPKYKGSLKPGNLLIFKDFLAKAGMADRAKDFLMASGKFQAALYKEEIEGQLRTPGVAGFQLLDLHDFPGQGTAPVGVLDVFWEQKGYITPEQYRRFCNDTVLLARMNRRVFTNDQPCEIPVEVSHFGPTGLPDRKASWRVRDTASGKELFSGSLDPALVKTGGQTPLGKISLPLSQISMPSQLNLEIVLDGSTITNDWNFWVYPANVETAAPKSITIARELDDGALQTLRAGGKVLLLIDPKRVNAKTAGGFEPIFWNRITFAQQRQHTLGIICDPKNAALASFPTNNHSDWQWWDIQQHCTPMVLDALPREIRPIVQMIDDWDMCRRLALVFEAQVDGGKLIVSSIEFDKDLEQRPASRQLLRSLLDYMNGDAFSPDVSVSADQIRSLIRPLTTIQKLGARIVRADSTHGGYEPASLIDGEPSTFWHTSWDGDPPPFPHEVVIEFTNPQQLRGLSLLQRQDGNRSGWIKRCSIYASDDGVNWSKLLASATLKPALDPQPILFDASVAPRFIKLIAESGFDNRPFAALAEIEVIE